SIGGGSTGAGSFTLHGTSNTLAGNVAPAQTLLTQGVGCISCAASLTDASGFTNAGSIVLDDNAGGCADTTLTVSSGTLTNTGTLDRKSVVEGKSVVNATLGNPGTEAINAETSIKRTSHTSGRFPVAATNN